MREFLGCCCEEEPRVPIFRRDTYSLVRSWPRVTYRSSRLKFEVRSPEMIRLTFIFGIAHLLHLAAPTRRAWILGRNGILLPRARAKLEQLSKSLSPQEEAAQENEEPLPRRGNFRARWLNPFQATMRFAPSTFFPSKCRLKSNANPNSSKSPAIISPTQVATNVDSRTRVNAT